VNKTKDSDRILGNLAQAAKMLADCPEFVSLIPEVRVNLVYAPPGATSPQQVAAIEGRITAVRGRPYAPGLPAFGASDHMARLVLEVRKYDAEINAGINFKCDPSIIEAVKGYATEKGLLFGWIDRRHEPDEVARQDGTSMPWKIKQLAERYGAIPRLFYEGEGWGKEPLFVVTGEDATQVTEIAIDIARRYRAKSGQ
jgi:predicted fused transcriptional regulator/phosphomethylpyrimidine kinase